MRFATVKVDTRVTSCVVRETELIDLGGLHSAQSLLGSDRAQLERLCDNASAASRYRLDAVELLQPWFVNSKVLGIGMNFTSFADSARELGMTIPAEPFWFARALSCLTGPFAEVLLPQGCDDLDYEGELVLVIGKRCHCASLQEAAAAIGAYTIGNDLTMRRRAAANLVLGKFFDTHAPIGPVLITADEIDDPHELTIRTLVNGELRQQGSTAEMILNCYQIVATLSQGMILHPGDLIFTGTPSGCGINQRPPRMLQADDRVRVEIAPFGAIDNTVVGIADGQRQDAFPP
jgi:2-keto-4-pentenoate hydratase/2-oxohepta-3-ene-1,7-dioic acid hydratase in catechol pathway